MAPSRIATCFSRVVLQAGEQAVGGEDEQARVVERARATSARSGARPRRRSRPRTRARSRSGGGRPRSAARRRRARAWSAAIASGSATRQSVLRVPSWSVASANGSPRRRLARAPRGRAPPASGKRLKMGERFARVARVRRSRSSFGPGMGALVRPDPARARSPPRARARRSRVRVRAAAVGRRVVLAQHPDGRLVLAAPARPAPAPLVRGVSCGRLVARRQVDLHHVVAGSAPPARARSSSSITSYGGAIRSSSGPADGGLVAKRPERLDVGHRRATLARSCIRSARGR